MSSRQTAQPGSDRGAGSFSEKPRWLQTLFTAIDAKDLDGFLAHLHDDVIFRFGNADAIVGKAGVSAAIGGFFDSIQSIEHTLRDACQAEEFVTCHGKSRYVRHDGSDLTVPFANVFYLAEDGRIGEYLIHIDLTPLHG